MNISTKNIGLTLLASIGVFFASFISANAVSVFTSGQVGTGAVNGYVLQTNGTNSTWVATSTLGISGGSSNTSPFIQTGVNIQNVSSSTAVGINTAPNFANLEVQASSSTANPFAVWGSTGNPYLTVIANGNVGIGTTTPNNKLTIDTPATGNGITFESAGTNLANIARATVNTAVSIAFDSAASNRPISINNGVAANTLLSVGGGNVGIASSTPAYLLSIKGANTASTTTSFQLTDSANTPILTVDNGGKVGIDNIPSTGITTSGLEVGDAGWQSAAVNTEAFIGTPVASRVGLIIRGASGQTADYFRITDVFGNTVFAFPASGVPSFNLGLNAGSAGMQIQGGNFYSVKTTGNDFEILNNSNGSLPFYATSFGSVGIGSSTPLSTLSVTGVGTTSPFTIASSSGNSMFSINNSGAALFNNQAGTSGFVLQSFGASAPPQWVATSSLGISGGSGITALTGDVTATGPGSVAATLATVNSNVGTFGSATQASVVTVNAKGLITAASNITITPALSSITGFGTGWATSLGSNIGASSTIFASNGTSGIWVATSTLFGASGGYSPVGTTGQLPYFSATNTLTATSSLFLSTTGFFGIGSTTPSAQLSVQAGTTTNTYFAIGNPSGPVMTVSSSSAPFVGIGSSTPAWSLTVAGTVGSTGLPAAGSGNVPVCVSPAGQFITGATATNCTPSSEIFKMDIATSTVGLDEIMQLRAVSFYFKPTADGNYDKQQNLGLIAQEVDKIDPRLVQHTNGEIAGIRLDNVISLIISSIQQIVKRDDSQDTKIAQLQAEIDSLKAGKNDYACTL